MNLKEFVEEEKKDRNLFWRLQSGEHQNLLYEALDEIERLSQPLEAEVIKKNAGIEFRPNIEDIDEIVTDNCRLHLEYMDNDLIWMDIELPNGDEYHVNIYHKDGKCHKHLKTSGEKVG